MSTTELQITCIIRNGPPDDCTCIIDIQSNGVQFSVDEVISGIINRGTRFYVKDPEDLSRVYVIPVPKQNPTYIRTKPNDTPDDNLLQLPDCK